MNTVRQCLVLIPRGCIRDNILAKFPADALHFYGSKGQKISIATSGLLYFTSGPGDVSHVWPLVITWMVQPSVFIRCILLWVATNVVKGRLFFITWDCFTNPGIFVLHLCWPLNCNMDGWGTVFIVLLGNLNRWSASLKNLRWCTSASFLVWCMDWASSNRKWISESQIVFCTKSYHYFKYNLFFFIS